MYPQSLIVKKKIDDSGIFVRATHHSDPIGHTSSAAEEPIQISVQTAINMERARVTGWATRRWQKKIKSERPSKSSAELEKFCRLVVGPLIKQAYGARGIAELSVAQCYDLAAPRYYHLKDPARHMQRLVAEIVDLGILERHRRGRFVHCLRLKIWPDYELPYLSKLRTLQSPAEASKDIKPDLACEAVYDSVLNSVGEDALQPSPGDDAIASAAKCQARLERLDSLVGLDRPESHDPDPTPAWLMSVAPDLVRNERDAQFWSVSKVTRADVLAVLPSVRRQTARKANYRPPSALLHGAASRHAIGAPIARRRWSL